MKNIVAGVLNVSYRDVGPDDGPVVLLLHGFPYDIHAYDDVAARLVQAGCRCIVPYLRGYGPTRFIDSATPRSGEQAALGADLLALLDALNIPHAILAGYDWGGRAACVVAALWPERVTGLVSCDPGYNIQDIAAANTPASPETERRLWYQYYLHGERGRAGLAANRGEFCRLLWKLWSPTWPFAESTFADTAQAFENPDFVDVVTHSYRHRYGLVAGDPDYAVIQERLAQKPSITVPTVILAGADDGVSSKRDGSTAVRGFAGKVRRQVIEGVGHNVPQEAPAEFADAIISLLYNH
ncbi:pimeloyl-ACP methyl ester carboxylesterase [Pseudomonas graminis]|uniref:alpha/beta fold hydrolase n=1 Tax=Pseudomonas graminis TaxID=158627 RepID=UPI00105BCEF6|nr:alpha/beta hydrolase [Pseudomonas graminis]TDV50154.1 pimeloyl-ACP methyl ester carboxylesterase [Pseudomonas graminis]